MGAHTNITGYGISINNGKVTDKGLLGSITNVGVTPSPQHYFFTKKRAYEVNILYNKSDQTFKKGCDFICSTRIISKFCIILKRNM